jgi:hypothetical protein
VSHFTNNYGCMYGSGIAIPITGVGIWSYVPSPLTAGNMDGFTFSGNGLVCQGAGTFFLALSASLECAANNQDVVLTYSINGNPAATSIKQSLVSSNRAFCMSLSDVVTLKLGDLVQIMVMNQTAKNNLTEVSTSLSIARLQR